MAVPDANQDGVVIKFREMMEECDAISRTLIEREHDRDEHDLVLKNLQKQDGTKRAWSLVGDILLERTVAETIPELTKQRDNMASLVQNLKKQLETKQKELLAYQEKYNIRIKDRHGGGTSEGVSSSPQGSNAVDKSHGQQGVLVSNS